LWPSLQSGGYRRHPQGQKQAEPPFAYRTTPASDGGECPCALKKMGGE